MRLLPCAGEGSLGKRLDVKHLQLLNDTMPQLELKGSPVQEDARLEDPAFLVQVSHPALLHADISSQIRT